MNLSSDLISQFVKVTNDKTEKKSESSNLGTVVIYNNTKYVKLDGSDLLTPVKTTTSVSDGDRVTVTIKDHSATVTGNLSDPSASGNTVTEIGKQISEFEIIIADKVSTEELEAEIARIDELVSDNATIKDTLTANKAIIEDLQAENATITGKLTADEAEIENLKTTKLDASVADITYATITDLEATNANIYNLEATYGDFEVLTTNKFTAIDATIKDLEADKLSATDAELKYANIDFANIGQAAIENFLSKSGMIGDLVVGDGTVTGTLIGVTIKGDLIEGNTIVADKLVIKGDDGLYYKLNTDGETVEAAQTEYNSLNGSVIIAKSVTASKIRVDDLVAFDATIGGFNITENSIYSGVKESVSNTTRGVYLDDDGQVAFGDASNFLKYYKDQNGDYRLEISAKTMVLGSSSKNVETEITNLQKATITGVDVLYAMSTSTTEAPTSGWSTTAPEWTDGMYMWQKTVITYGDGSTEESAITCISGATGATGESGNDGGTGSDGKGINTIIEQYYQSSSAIDLIGGSWSSTSPTWKDGYYVWTRTVITYDDNTSVTTSPICITGSKGETGAAGKDGNDGVSVTSVDVYYYVSTSSTTLSGGSWSTDAPTWTDGTYIWSKTVTTYSDNTSTESEPACITGGKGATGATGESGSDGNGVSSIVEQYYRSSSSTSLTGGTWSTTYPGWKDGYYIWTRSVITYTDKSSVTTTAVCVTGSKGETGATGKGVSKSEVYYYLSTSNTTQTGGSWSTTVPTWKDGYYYWQKIITTYTDSTTSESTPVCITGAKGSTGVAGSDGSDGVGVESIVTQFYLSTSKTTQTGGSWVTTMPTWSTGMYLWTRSLITYTDGTTATTSPICDSSWEAVNEVEVGGRNYIKGGKGDSDSGIFKNFDTINIDECYAEHTLTSQKTYANIDISSGFVLGCRDYEVGSQVTWSYDIMFTAWDFPDGATRSEWWFGQRYTKDSTDSTNTTGALRGVTYHNLPVIGSNGCELNEWYHVEKTITIPEQAADGINTAGSIQFYNSNADVSASVTFRLKNVKLEYGNKATDWTPAIEDVDDDISNAQSSADEANGKADSNATRITEAETLIAKLEDCIAMMVTDENGMSLMTQTDTGWTFNIAELRDAVDSASSGLDTLKNSLGSTDATVDALQQAVSDLEETAEYVRITTYEDEPCIELGEGDSDFKLLITNTRIMFMNGSDIPTYISNTGLVTKNIEVEDELVFGNWAWKVRSNGNLGLVWKG